MPLKNSPVRKTDSKSLAIAIIAVLIAMCSIQWGATLAKNLFPLIGAEGTTALRLSVAALILACVFRPWRRHVTKAELKSVIAYGLSLGAMNYLFYLSLARIPLGIAVALEFTGPLAVSVMSSKRRLDFIWVLFAIAGIVLILPLTAASASIDFIGALLALAAGLCWAGYIVFGQRAGGQAHAGTVTSLGMIVAALLVVPLGIVHSGASLLDTSLIPLAIGVGIFSSALPYSLEMIALKRLPAKNFGILMSLEPAIAAIAGLLFLRETLSPIQVAAIGLIIVASVGSSMQASEPGAAPPAPTQS